jgi:hypothetical protein
MYVCMYVFTEYERTIIIRLRYDVSGQQTIIGHCFNKNKEKYICIVHFCVVRSY